MDNGKLDKIEVVEYYPYDKMAVTILTYAITDINNNKLGRLSKLHIPIKLYKNNEEIFKEALKFTQYQTLYDIYINNEANKDMTIDINDKIYKASDFFK